MGRRNMADKINPIRETTAEAISLARKLIDDAHFGSLAVIDPETGAPYVSRVAVATDEVGTPIILVSALARHTQGLLKNPLCSLLLGEPGKGDPLAHPRITLACLAQPVIGDALLLTSITKRFLRHQPKAKLYAALPDFSFFRLDIENAWLNGGFGRAFILSAENIGWR